MAEAILVITVVGLVSGSVSIYTFAKAVQATVVLHKK
jgi:hypothetical protein